jgi:hypothetical protein
LRLKWIAIVFLALFFASCATLTYNQPPWGTSEEAYPILTLSVSDAMRSFRIDINEVPSQNKIQLRFSQREVFEVFDRGGALNSLRGALTKYVEWKEQLKETGGKVSKPIGEIDFFYPKEDKIGVYYNFHSLRLNFETGSDGRYYLRVSEVMERSLGNGNYSDPQLTGTSVLLSEDQVLALSQALSQENLLAKAKEADEVANQKATEEKKNQDLQDSLK